MALSVHLERFITEELCVVIDEAKCIITVNRVRDEVDNFEFDGPSTCFRNKDASFVKLGRAGKKKKKALVHEWMATRFTEAAAERWQEAPFADSPADICLQSMVRARPP